MKGEAPPPTTQIDNAHAVFDAGVFAVLFEHGDLRFLKGRRRSGPQAGGVLFAGSQTQVVKFGRNFVVLFVGIVGGNCNGHRLELVYDF